ncbi:MAG: glycosyltransferase family 4 protein, partial [Victivallales bacterium]|nr:glycosyltransferase family 4 protein [Victivallales bacterium]
HRVRAICRMPQGKIAPSDIADFRGYIDIFGGTPRKTSHYRRSIRRLLEECLSERVPDVIILHSSSAAFGTLDLLRKVDIPIIYYFHSPWSLEHESKLGESRIGLFNPSRLLGKVGSYIRKMHERRYLLASNGIVTLSEYMADEMIATHGRTVKLKSRRVIPGGVAQDVFSPVASMEEKNEIRTRFSLSPEAFVLISSRRMIPRTGLDLLIRAFALLHNPTGRGDDQDALKNSGPPLTLVLTGDGVSMKALKRLAVDLGVGDDVRFTGYVSESDLADYYRCADLFVMPTRNLEGFGLSTVEAMASGLPVVGTNIGGTPEILSRISRDLIIHEPTAAAISAKIAEFMAMDDLSEWRKRSLAAVVERHTWRSHVDALLYFADRLLNA